MVSKRRLTFSQMNLQDFVDCPKRFELAHLLQQKWPAIRSEPVMVLEKQMRLGQDLHLLAQQLFTDISIQDIAQQVDDPQMMEWWKSLVEFSKPFLQLTHYAEHKISGVISDKRCVAILDLIVFERNKVIIIDWKTNQKKPTREKLVGNIQSRLYPSLLLQAYEMHDHPERVEMIYWFATQPQEPEVFQYSNAQYQEDLQFFDELFAEIDQRMLHGFEKTSTLSLCKFCRFRSFCERGDTAGFLDDDSQESWAEEINIEDILQIGEISF